MMRFILASLFLPLLLLPARAGHSAPKILFRIHVQTSGEGLSGQEAMPVALTHPNENIIVRMLPEITETEILSVTEEAGGTRLTFNHSGKISLSAFTAQDQGRVMVVFLNNEVIYAPVIDEQITSGQLFLPVTFKPEVLENLQEIAKKNTQAAERL